MLTTTSLYKHPKVYSTPRVIVTVGLVKVKVKVKVAGTLIDCSVNVVIFRKRCNIELLLPMTTNLCPIE